MDAGNYTMVIEKKKNTKHLSNRNTSRVCRLGESVEQRL